MIIVCLLLKKQKLKNTILILCTFLVFLMALFLMQCVTLLPEFRHVVFALFLYCVLAIALIYFYSCVSLKPLISYFINCFVYFLLIVIVVMKPRKFKYS